MTLSDVRAILEKDYQKHYNNVIMYNNYNIDKAYEYIQQQTGCDIDIAKRIVDEMNYKKQQIDKSTIKCPYCNSTSVVKITKSSKAVRTFLFGIFAISRNSKNFHCNNCTADF